MKTLSYWAKNHPQKARFLLVVLHVLAAVNALLLGTILYLFDWIPPNGWHYPLVVLALLALVFYPRSAKGSATYRATYGRRKFHDFSLAFLGTLMLAFFTTGFLVDNSFYYETDASVSPARQVAYHRQAPPVERPKPALKKRFLKKQRQQLRKTLRHVKQQLRQPDALGVGWKIVLAILVIVIAIGLGVLIFGLACSLACSGSGTLSLVVLIGGWAALITLSIWLIAIIFKNKKIKRDRGSEME